MQNHLKSLNQRGWSVGLLWLLLLLPPWATPVRADKRLEGDSAVAAGRDALARQSGVPWYDRAQDSVRRVTVAPEDPAEAAARDSQWVAKEKVRRQWTGWNWNWNLGETMQWIVRVLVGLLILALIGLLIWAFLKVGPVSEPGVAGQLAADEQRTHRTRVENLPFQLQGPDSDLLAEARRHYTAGNFRAAVIYLFSYKLVELDKRHVIRLTKGKTNRQYLREVRRSIVELVPILERTMIAFEDVFFGDHNLERDDFEKCWNQLDEFVRLADRSPTLGLT